jgi:hypothetical protein
VPGNCASLVTEVFEELRMSWEDKYQVRKFRHSVTVTALSLWHYMQVLSSFVPSPPIIG